MRFINIGFSNMISAERIVALASPESAPIKRLIQDSRESGRAIDCTCGKKTKSVLIMDSDHVILSALPAETLAARMSGNSEDQNSDEQSEGAHE
ncbi:MAG: DUF370 domain-containing protein [Clostridia bacterium]|nr:DUF370 domain-containing protein [Clostridia bacterium]